eukprot:COSAG02_NODE_3104_length_7366_cov_7.224302_1_plen_73_part_00
MEHEDKQEETGACGGRQVGGTVGGESHQVRDVLYNQIPAEEIYNYDDLIDKLKKTKKWLCATDSKANADVFR